MSASEIPPAVVLPIETVRRIHEVSRDPRVARARTKIFNAVELLISRKQDPITVADIVREAGVSKTSFYSHFASFDALALYVVERAYSELTAIGRPSVSESAPDARAAIRSMYLELVDHYFEHRSFYVSVLRLPLPRSVHTQAVRSMAADIEPAIAANPALPQGLRPHLAASFIASAVVGFFDEWLEDDFDGTAQELLEHLMTLLPGWYTGTGNT